jgi:hypothetical protein
MPYSDIMRCLTELIKVKDIQYNQTNEVFN